MASTRTLSSVAHDIAHHAASSMSSLHPHAFRAARAAGVAELSFDLLAEAPLAIPVDEALRLASEGVHRKFLAMLSHHGFALGALHVARLTMLFPTNDEHYCVTHARLETPGGKTFEKSSTSLG